MRLTLARLCMPLLLLGLLGFPVGSSAFWNSAGKASQAISRILHSPHAVPDSEITRWSKMAAETKGTAKIGAELGKRNLPNDVLEDIFLRIAIDQGRIPRDEAVGMFHRLTGVPGFRTTLRKVIGNSEVGTAGHLYELRLADDAASRGIKVIAIGEKFSDGLKKAPTDIDLVLQSSRKTFVVEAKNYASSTTIQFDRYRADLDSLVAYREKSGKNIVAVFCMQNRPGDPGILKKMQHEAQRRNVELIFGTPQEGISQIKTLGEIL